MQIHYWEPDYESPLRMNAYYKTEEELAERTPEQIEEDQARAWWVTAGSRKIEPRAPKAECLTLVREKRTAGTEEKQQMRQKPVLRFIPPAEIIPGCCDNCMLRRNGDCSQVRNELCADYKAIPFVSAAERASWRCY